MTCSSPSMNQVVDTTTFSLGIIALIRCWHIVAMYEVVDHGIAVLIDGMSDVAFGYLGLKGGGKELNLRIIIFANQMLRSDECPVKCAITY